MKNRLLVTTVAMAVAMTSFGAAASDSATFKGATKDAWITGKVETAFVLNTALNPFTIGTDVDAGVVHLTGTVKSNIDRDLAGEIAKGVRGVVRVENDLVVDARAAPQRTHDGKRDFGSWVDDATTTAAVKSKLVANSNIRGLKIDVDTRGDVVTLSGRVPSEQARDLAVQIARNTGDVKGVRNDLVVDPN